MADVKLCTDSLQNNIAKLDTIRAFAQDELNSDSWVATEKTRDTYQHYVGVLKTELQSCTRHTIKQTPQIVKSFNPSVVNLIEMVMTILPDNYTEITEATEDEINADLKAMRRAVNEISHSLEADSFLNMLKGVSDSLKGFDQGFANIKAQSTYKQFMIVIEAQNKEMKDTNLSDIGLLVPLNQAMLSDFLTIMSDVLKEIKQIGKSSSSQKYEENVANLTSKGRKAVSRPIHRFVILSN